MACEVLIDSYVYLLIVILNLLLLITSVMISDQLLLTSYPNNLPIIASALFFITAVIDYLYFNVQSVTSILMFLDCLSWTLDFISRQCLLFFSMFRLKTLVPRRVLMYYGIFAFLVNLGCFVFLLATTTFDLTYQQADISISLYSAADLLVLALDFYLAYLVSKVGNLRSGIFPRLKELLLGPGLSVLFGCVCCILSFALKILGLDEYYFFYTHLFILRIFMLQIFNERLVVMFFKKRANMLEGSKNVETKEVLEMWRLRGKDGTEKKDPKVIAKGSLSSAPPPPIDSINVAKTIKVGPQSPH